MMVMMMTVNVNFELCQAELVDSSVSFQLNYLIKFHTPSAAQRLTFTDVGSISLKCCGPSEPSVEM